MGALYSVVEKSTAAVGPLLGGIVLQASGFVSAGGKSLPPVQPESALVAIIVLSRGRSRAAFNVAGSLALLRFRLDDADAASPADAVDREAPARDSVQAALRTQRQVGEHDVARERGRSGQERRGARLRPGRPIRLDHGVPVAQQLARLQERVQLRERLHTGRADAPLQVMRPQRGGTVETGSRQHLRQRAQGVAVEVAHAHRLVGWAPGRAGAADPGSRRRSGNGSYGSSATGCSRRRT